MRPLRSEELSGLIGSIYDCALDPSLWHEALIALCRALRFSNASLALQEMPNARVLLDVTTGMAEEDIVRMRTYGPDVVEQWGGYTTMAALPLEEPLILSRVNPRHAESRYSREFAAPLGLIDTLAIGFCRDDRTLSSLGMGRHRDDGPIGDNDIDLARLFVPHLRRALEISRILEARTVERDSFAAVLDGLATAVLLLAPDLRLLHANRAAEAMLCTGGPLRLRRGRLAALPAVEAAIVAALAVPLDRLGRRGLGIPVRSADGEELVLHLLPLAPDAVSGAAAALFVAPAHASRPPPLDAIAVLFDLTPAETRVLASIAAGRNEAEVAATLGIAASTVHTHLLRLFHKTRTRRQADLVALVAAFSMPLA